jgi:hypothetical protein
MRWCRLQRDKIIGFGWVPDNEAEVGRQAVLDQYFWTITHTWETRSSDDIEPWLRNAICVLERRDEALPCIR